MKKNIELSSQIPTELDLINYFHSGSKSSEDYKIGTENEKFLFHKESLCPLQYSDGPGIVDVFKILIDQFHWSPIFDGDNVIGLSDAQNDRNISLEPGGQIELSGSKCSNLHQTNEEFKQYHSQIEYVCNELNIGALGLGFSPKWGFKDMAKVPKTRYTIMREYMPKVGSHGLDMMHCSATTQVNLDYSDENDFTKKFRVAMALQPLISVMFFNSPFLNGRLTGLLSNRLRVWANTDNDRCGYLPFAFDDHNKFEDYAQYALDVPMYFIYRNGRYVIPNHMSFRNFLSNGFMDDKGENFSATMDDWETHLSTLFPQVRLKKFLEMRGADSGNHSSILSLASIWTGLMYNNGVLDEVYKIISKWTHSDILHLDECLNKDGLNTRFMGHAMLDLLKELVSLSKQGLSERNIRNEHDATEEIYLEPLFEVLTKKRTSSDILISEFHHEWSSEVKPIYNKHYL